jgi:hypothetical protein
MATFSRARLTPSNLLRWRLRVKIIVTMIIPTQLPPRLGTARPMLSAEARMKEAWKAWAGWMFFGVIWALFGWVTLLKSNALWFAIGLLGVGAAFGLRGVYGYVRRNRDA